MRLFYKNRKFSLWKVKGFCIRKKSIFRTETEHTVCEIHFTFMAKPVRIGQLQLMCVDEYCWFARDVMEAMSVVKNPNISIL